MQVRPAGRTLRVCPETVCQADSQPSMPPRQAQTGKPSSEICSEYRFSGVSARSSGRLSADGRPNQPQGSAEQSFDLQPVAQEPNVSATDGGNQQAGRHALSILAVGESQAGQVEKIAQRCVAQHFQIGAMEQVLVSIQWRDFRGRHGCRGHGDQTIDALDGTYRPYQVEVVEPLVVDIETLRCQGAAALRFGAV